MVGTMEGSMGKVTRRETGWVWDDEASRGSVGTGVGACVGRADGIGVVGKCA